MKKDCYDPIREALRGIGLAFVLFIAFILSGGVTIGLVAVWGLS